FSVVGLLAVGGKVYASDSQNHLRIARRQANRSYTWDEPIKLAGPKVKGVANPAGMAPGEPGTLWVTSTRGNSVQRLNLRTGRVEQVVPVGVAPYAICRPQADRLYVSNWGGDRPPKGRSQALSSGTPVRTDPRTGIADQGTVSVLARGQRGWKQRQTIRVGLHPSGLIASPRGR